MTTFCEVVRLKEFDRELKKLGKLYRTLEEDLETFINTQLFAFHKLAIDNRGLFRIDDLGPLTAPVYKAKKFACRALKGKGSRTGIRVIYAYFPGEDRVELVEIYIKSLQEVENRERIKKHHRRE